ncbi:MAG: hypothetical protein AAF222_08315 [Pseudomonadota bacterium]
MSDQPILVIAATGKTGAGVVKRLETLGKPVRYGTRHAPIRFDWDTPDTWRAALDGVRAAIFASRSSTWMQLPMSSFPR